MKTLLLDRSAWDVVLDSGGNWAVATEPYSLAQDVSSAVRTFIGECWYNTTLGVPYWQQILGYLPPFSLVQEKVTAAALTVQGVETARTVITEYTERTLSGVVYVNGDEIQASF